MPFCGRSSTPAPAEGAAIGSGMTGRRDRSGSG
jgi:hypothetical protein